MVALVVIGLVLANFQGRGAKKISEERAVEIARPQVDFTPEGHNIRFVRRGIPPHGFWAVSFWIKDANGSPSQITVVLVDASTGRIDEVREGV